jgi:hypothetical protein
MGVETAPMDSKAMAEEKSKEVVDVPVEATKRQTRTIASGLRSKSQPKAKRQSPKKLVGAANCMVF